MNKKVKLIIEIIIFILVLCAITFIYYFNNSNKEESASVSITSVTDENFEKEVLNSDKPVILEFTSKTCPPCVAMLTTLIDIAKNNDDIKVATLDIDSDETKNTTDEYEVSATPTLIIFENGKVKDTLVGAIGEDKIMEAIGK